MKKIFRISLFFLFALLIACNDEEVTNPIKPPVIEGIEVGSDHVNPNNSQAYIGRDFHVAASILCSHKIAQLLITVMPVNAGDGIENWQYKKDFTDYHGQLNAEFHEHIVVPRTTKTGVYTFQMTVVDEKGLKDGFTKELNILERPQRKN